MRKNDRISIIVAETSPIVAAGLNVCLKRLPGISAIPYEARNYENLTDLIREHHPEIVMVSPSFCGVFDPGKLRGSLPEEEFKLVAIETGSLSSQTRQLYDESVAVVDELNVMAEKLSRLINIRPDDNEEKDALSQREKEIITLVAKGLTNKEIADKLFLSVHTVITHRRNIARKLEIHSATGLAIYAIVNHLVDLKEIKI